MKQFVIVFAMVALTLGNPVPEESKRSLPAVEYKDERDDSGYKIHYITAEGTIVSENGRWVPTADGKDKVLVTDGEVTFVGPDGKSYVTKWSAGVEGTKVEGAHLPVAPAVPVIEPEAVVEPVKVAEPAPLVVESAPAEVEAAPFVLQAPALPILPQSEVVVPSL